MPATESPEQPTTRTCIVVNAFHLSAVHYYDKPVGAIEKKAEVSIANP